MGYFLGCRIDRGSKQSDIAIPNIAIGQVTVAVDAPIVIDLLIEFRIGVASLLVKFTSVRLHLGLHVSWNYHPLAALIIVVLKEVDLLLGQQNLVSFLSLIGLRSSANKLIDVSSCYAVLLQATKLLSKLIVIRCVVDSRGVRIRH